MLKYPIAEITLFFDLEWVPDAEAAKRLYNLPADTTEADAMQKLWEMSSGYSEDVPHPFVKYLFSRIVSIAFLSRRRIYREGELGIEFRLNSYPALPDNPGSIKPEDVIESEIIKRFLDAVGKKRPNLVGFNSSESDFQVLIQRGIINEVSAPDFCRRPEKNWEADDYFKRWDNEMHLDLAKLFGNSKLMPKLDEIAKLCGYPGKIDTSGDQVWQLWLNRDLDQIIKYNRLDVLNTYLIWLRIAYFTGKLSDEEYQMEQDDFRAFLENEAAKPSGDYIKKFLSAWIEH
ncbi:MAG TPA: ribonuclease H-like domain-containing protein [Pyrinomonadaceae bacterium]|nr:ribonuclease H-like domain-containing protein [Pyrinomonadaceae bacterium]